MILGEVKKNPRGFEFVEFQDMYRAECSLQQSSVVKYGLPGTSAVWLGVGDHRMHLNREQAEALVETLQCWLRSGSFAKGDAAGG